MGRGNRNKKREQSAAQGIEMVSFNLNGEPQKAPAASKEPAVMKRHTVLFRSGERLEVSEPETFRADVYKVIAETGAAVIKQAAVYVRIDETGNIYCISDISGIALNQ